MRYVRLTELIPELLDMVDEKKIAFNPAYELSFWNRTNSKCWWKQWTMSRLPLLSLRLSEWKVQPGREIVRRCDACHHVRGKRVIWIKWPWAAIPCESISPKAIHRPKCRKPLLNCWNNGRKTPTRSGTMKGEPMKDIAARELKGHNILAVERFGTALSGWLSLLSCALLLMENLVTKWGFSHRGRVSVSSAKPAASRNQIKRYAHVIEGHILDFKPKNTVVHNRYNERKGMNMCTVREIREAIQEDCRSQRDMESTEIDRVFKPYHFSGKGSVW